MSIPLSDGFSFFNSLTPDLKKWINENEILFWKYQSIRERYADCSEK
jgi:hypothetical protein